MFPVKECAARLKVLGRNGEKKGGLASRICFAAPNQSTETYVLISHHELIYAYEAGLGQGDFVPISCISESTLWISFDFFMQTSRHLSLSG